MGVKLAVELFFFFGACSPFRTGKCFIGVVKNNEDKAGLCGGRNAFFNACEWMAPHIPQQQALCWMAALTRLFSLLTAALCLLATDRIIYLPNERGFDTRLTCWKADFKLFFPQFQMNKDNISAVTFRFKHVHLTLNLEIGSSLTSIATFNSFYDVILVASGQFSCQKGGERQVY